MIEYKEPRGKILKSYKYPLKSVLFGGSIKAFIICLVLGGIFAYGDPEEAGVIWTIFGFFALIFSVGGVNMIFVHQPIEIYENGLSAFALGGFPKRRQFLPWSRITRVEPFAHPHWHSDGRNSGVILWHDSKFLVIDEELEKFEEFLIHLRSNLKQFPEMAHWVDPLPFGNLTGKTIGTYSYKPGGRYFGLYTAPIYILMAAFLQLIGTFFTSAEIDYFDLQPHHIKGMAIMWGVFLGLAWFQLYFGKSRYVLLKPIFLTEDGILGPLNDKKHREPWYWKEPASIFFRWSDIHLMNKITGSNYDSNSVNMQEGIRLMAGLNKIMIYKNISHFSEVESILKAKLPDLASCLNEEK